MSSLNRRDMTHMQVSRSYPIFMTGNIGTSVTPWPRLTLNSFPLKAPLHSLSLGFPVKMVSCFLRVSLLTLLFLSVVVTVPIRQAQCRDCDHNTDPLCQYDQSACLAKTWPMKIIAGIGESGMSRNVGRWLVPSPKNLGKQMKKVLNLYTEVVTSRTQ